MVDQELTGSSLHRHPCRGFPVQRGKRNFKWSHWAEVWAHPWKSVLCEPVHIYWFNTPLVACCLDSFFIYDTSKWERMLPNRFSLFFFTCSCLKIISLILLNRQTFGIWGEGRLFRAPGCWWTLLWNSATLWYLSWKWDPLGRLQDGESILCLSCCDGGRVALWCPEGIWTCRFEACGGHKAEKGHIETICTKEALKNSEETPHQYIQIYLKIKKR